MFRKLAAGFTAVLCAALLTVSAFAHPGNTDSSGGHYNRSTGEYHYHHGYPEHQHTNDVCPYDFDDKTGENSGAPGDNVKKNYWDQHSIDSSSFTASSTPVAPIYLMEWIHDNDDLLSFLFIGSIVAWPIIWYLFLWDFLSKGKAGSIRNTLSEFGLVGSYMIFVFISFLLVSLVTTVQLFLHEGIKACVTLLFWAFLFFFLYPLFRSSHPKLSGKKDPPPTDQPALQSPPKPPTPTPPPEPPPLPQPEPSEPLPPARPIPPPEPQPKKSSVPLHGTDSSAISHWGYDVYSQRLFLRMRDSGIMYVYFDVPYEVAADLRHTPSIGRYYNTAIKGKYHSHNLGYKAVRDNPPRS